MAWRRHALQLIPSSLHASSFLFEATGCLQCTLRLRIARHSRISLFHFCVAIAQPFPGNADDHEYGGRQTGS